MLGRSIFGAEPGFFFVDAWFTICSSIFETVAVAGIMLLSVALILKEVVAYGWRR